MPEKKSASEMVDYFFNKVLPKKFIVFIIATGLAIYGLTKETPWLSGEQWSWIAITYLGANGVLGAARGFSSAIGRKDIVEKKEETPIV